MFGTGDRTGIEADRDAHVIRACLGVTALELETGRRDEHAPGTESMRAPEDADVESTTAHERDRPTLGDFAVWVAMVFVRRMVESVHRQIGGRVQYGKTIQR